MWSGRGGARACCTPTCAMGQGVRPCPGQIPPSHSAVPRPDRGHAHDGDGRRRAKIDGHGRPPGLGWAVLVELGARSAKRVSGPRAGCWPGLLEVGKTGPLHCWLLAAACAQTQHRPCPSLHSVASNPRCSPVFWVAGARHPVRKVFNVISNWPKRRRGCACDAWGSPRGDQEENS